MATVLVPGRRNGFARAAPPSTEPVKVAIYCRVSTTERLGQDFNSLDNQQASCEAYIASQMGARWQAIPDQYHDGGFSGANVERPALRRLLGDIRAGRVDVVLTYRLDRLTRSIRDFFKILEDLENHNAAFASVSEAFNTNTPMGRMALHVMLAFAQMEREVTSERTRDKVKAAQKRGKWIGGCVPLGYDLAPGGGKLVVNEAEAFQVRELFAAYLRTGSLVETAAEANEKDWRSKATPTKDGRSRGGQEWNKANLHGLLTSATVIGRVAVDGTVYASETPAIVEESVWNAVQERLQANATEGSRVERRKSGALLAGFVFCSCGAALTPTFVSRRVGNASKRYSYYACSRRIKQGKSACSARYVPAHELESQVIAGVAARAGEPEVIAAVTEATRQRLAEQRKALAAEKRAIEKAIQADDRYRVGLAPELAEAVDARMEGYRARLAEIEQELGELGEITVDSATIAEALADFPGLWDALLPRERRRAVELLIGRVVCGTACEPVLELEAAPPTSLVLT